MVNLDALNGISRRLLKKQKASRPEILKTVDSGLHYVDDLDDEDLDMSDADLDEGDGEDTFGN
jgi:hypothetical protein